MLILNTGQVPWNLRRQIETVFSTMINEIISAVPEMEVYTVDDPNRRTKGGQYHANDLIELYLAFGEELTNERQHAKEVLYEYNMLKPNEIEKRDNLLRGLFGSVGEKFYIEPPFRCDYGYNIYWGENSYANYNLTVLDCAKVVIGDDVLIGPNVNIFTAAHPISPSQRKLGLEFAKDIEIFRIEKFILN